MITQAGTYAARCIGAYNYTNNNGSHVLRLDFELEGMPGEVVSSWHTIAKADGSIMSKGIEALRMAYQAWDGTDPWWFEDNDLSGIPVELVVEMKPGYRDVDHLYPSVKWVNPPGGGNGGGQSAPKGAAADRAAFMARFGAKLRANAGPSAAKPPKAAPAPAPKPVPTAAPATPAKKAPAATQPPPKAAPLKKPASQNSAWELCISLHKDTTAEECERIWFEAVDSTGKPQDAMDANDWAAVETYLKNGARPQAAADGELPQF